METKQFPTDVVLTIVTGIFLIPERVRELYGILDWMTDESLYTHQLPRVGKEAVPVILAHHPDLGQAIEESKQVTKDNCLEWVSVWQARYGDTINVPKLTKDTHEWIDPISELAQMVSPDNIIIIEK